jgi:hypothetical protein
MDNGIATSSFQSLDPASFTLETAGMGEASWLIKSVTKLRPHSPKWVSRWGTAMPKHQLLRQVKAKSLTVKIPKNEPNTARLSWVLGNEEFLTVEIPRYALERFMVQAKRAIEEAPLSLGGVRAGSGHAECDEIT